MYFIIISCSNNSEVAFDVPNKEETKEQINRSLTIHIGTNGGMFAFLYISNLCI